MIQIRLIDETGEQLGMYIVPVMPRIGEKITLHGRERTILDINHPIDEATL